MIVTCAADLHIRGKRPRMREDDFVEAQFRKLNEMVKITGYGWLLLAGDIFDRWDVSLNVIRRVIETLQPLEGRCIIVRGNHDTAYHSKSVDGSPLGILEASGVCQYLDDQEDIHLDDRISVTGLGWQGDYQEPVPGNYNILLAHFSVYENKPPHYMPNALSVKDFEKKFPGFDRYIVGDIHITCEKLKTIVPGSMMRNNSDQQKHKPCVFVLDTDTDTVEKLFLKVEEDVFDLKAIEAEKETKLRVSAQEEQLLTMTTKMKSVEDIIDFDTILNSTSENSSEEVKQIVREVMVK